MRIGDFNTDESVLVIAEIGNNHEGSYSLAEDMIGLAAEAGAGAVKFQTIIPGKLVSVFQKERIKQLKRFQLSYEEFERLSKVAKQENVIFLSTPFDIESARFLEPLVPAYKIGSGDNNFFPMIDVIARTGKPIIISAGLTNMQGIREAVNFITNIWNQNAVDQVLAVMHCVASYPVPLEEANLQAITVLRGLGVTVGYSDHTVGIEAAVLSVALGAKIIEKHFTLNKNYSDFHDHRLSADPKEFSQLVDMVNNASKLLDQNKNDLQECEQLIMNNVRRSIVAKTDLDENTVLTWDHLSWVRPGSGISPGNEEKVLGKRLIKSVSMGELITLDNLI